MWAGGWRHSSVSGSAPTGLRKEHWEKYVSIPWQLQGAARHCFISNANYVTSAWSCWSIIRRSEAQCQQYADDTHLYFSIKHDSGEAVHKLNQCLDLLVMANKLKLSGPAESTHTPTVIALPLKSIFIIPNIGQVKLTLVAHGKRVTGSAWVVLLANMVPAKSCWTTTLIISGYWLCLLGLMVC